MKNNYCKSDYTEQEKRSNKLDASEKINRLIENEMLTFNISHSEAMRKIFTAEENIELIRQYTGLVD